MKWLQAIPKRWLPWLIGGAFALLALTLTPTLMRHDTVVQIRVSHAGAPMPDGFYLYQQLTAQGIRIKSITPSGDALVIHFESEEQSLAAQKVLRRLLPQGFIVAQYDQAERQSLA
ncbi:EnvZ/OmpR regulon moderator MzrA [Pantoea sp. LMR881]|uniref:EnvZ/OmpR regulon moderator MzrA n=1 Tax=Pantoea sp. LMR881 TaxID=3014336 RepID=UPI0022AFA529|nr:EnvZ/OmpR regulon moderator MzrA [Pantoea sp. LMR881]MCZ4060136.1 EnvZ/OmpR regulon moderator MzrA [Pantoea sp. LMR881]